MLKKEQTIAILDVGKTNKKLFLFDKQYNIVYQQNLTFPQRYDEDGYECEDLPAIESFLLTTLKELINSGKYDIKAINFSAYGASLVHLGETGRPLVDMFNYLKPYPKELLTHFFSDPKEQRKFELETCCPIQGNLNAGLQLFRIFHQRKELFANTVTSLHFPQYLSYLLTGKKNSDITSIGCHTSLWDFGQHTYHSWIKPFYIDRKLAPLKSNDSVEKILFEDHVLSVGIGMHDSSAALVPYLKTIKEPFLLVSTGTWSITLNPFNETPLSESELCHGCLCYLNYLGQTVKASRVFLGNVYEREVNRITSYFQIARAQLNDLKFDKDIFSKLKSLDIQYHPEKDFLLEKFPFSSVDLMAFSGYEQAYYQLIYELAIVQIVFIKTVDTNDNIGQVFIDGGFGHNKIFMNAIAMMLDSKKVYAAEVPQSTAIGAALVIHDKWTHTHIKEDLVRLEYYSSHLKMFH